MNDEIVSSYIWVSQALDYQITSKSAFFDIAYLADGIGKKYENGILFNFYENSFLFAIDSDENCRAFGTADDWIVLSNSKNSGNIGKRNTEQMAIGNTVVVRMAYIFHQIFARKMMRCIMKAEAAQYPKQRKHGQK